MRTWCFLLYFWIKGHIGPCNLGLHIVLKAGRRAVRHVCDMCVVCVRASAHPPSTCHRAFSETRTRVFSSLLFCFWLSLCTSRESKNVSFILCIVSALDSRALLIHMSLLEKPYMYMCMYMLSCCAVLVLHPDPGVAPETST